MAISSSTVTGRLSTVTSIGVWGCVCAATETVLINTHEIRTDKDRYSFLTTLASICLLVFRGFVTTGHSEAIANDFRDSREIQNINFNANCKDRGPPA